MNNESNNDAVDILSELENSDSNLDQQQTTSKPELSVDSHSTAEEIIETVSDSPSGATEISESQINNKNEDEINNIIDHFQSITVKYVKGDFSLDSILNKANIAEASNAIILNDKKNSKDEKVILSTLTIKKISPKIKVIAQINDKDKTSFLKRANVDAVLSNDDFESFMTMSHISNPGVAHTINNLIDTNSKNSITTAVQSLKSDIPDLPEIYFELIKESMIAPETLEELLKGTVR